MSRRLFPSNVPDIETNFVSGFSFRYRETRRVHAAFGFFSLCVSS
jgi:hypothetical protein